MDWSDGRRVRGERRRSAIIAATLRVVERDGVAGVTHRAVAREAGVPASSATYYFATLDDLLVAALTAAAEEYARQLREIVDGGRDEIEGLAQLIADGGGPGRARALAERELELLAVRRPALRPVARHWRDTVAAVAWRYTDDPLTVEELVAAADGLCTRVLLEDEPPAMPEILAVLRRAVHPKN
ncbi:TetR/AcrR family transcriptional regulator [Amycolatopsis anabasis]|uniref:TetR/AcrR family transcriptional regulator n=1 Tax=Amycolatopsis anabasis TaxID=1840409 RepID=UPI001C555DF6|nr:TetR family transcriptional regulator [Amycolatopsis anabasis]